MRDAQRRAAPGALEDATKAVAEAVAAGRPGVVMTEGPAGFAMVAGCKSELVRTIPGGVLIAFGFDARQLAQFRDRIDQLLGDQPRAGRLLLRG